jgi:predicted RND superfamily exporter protein
MSATGQVIVNRKSGQATTEFVVTAGLLLVTVAMVALFLYTFREYGGRVLNLVAAEYP